ncbi:unnamed protein product, partial [Symbiodinium sp. CCMP2456]
MEALLFARHVFGIQAFDPLAISRRCWGAGAARLAKAISKAAGLRVSDLEALHRILDSSSNPWDRLFAGCALFCVYARCRWSDAQHVDSFKLDQGPDSTRIEYIEALVDVHKNMNRRGKSPVLLELVAPGLGVCSEGWIEKFLDARSALQLTSDHAFMPAPDITGHSHPGRMSDEYADDAMARAGRFVGGDPTADLADLPEDAGQDASDEEVASAAPGGPAARSPSVAEEGGLARRAMALVDSKASFKTRCVDMCGNDTLYQRLAGKDIRTFSDLAFACGTPQSPPSQDDFRNFSDEILGVGASLGDTAKLTRLHFEASTYVIAQLKQQVVGDTTDEPKRLPLAEKEARYRDLKLRLPGLIIQGELLPSHALVDAVAHMAETNCLTWLAPSKCTKRDQELRIGPKDKSKVLTVLDNSVTVTAQPEKIVADHSTPLQLQWCLQRRGLAFDMNRIISWETHEKWVSHLLQCLTADT